MRKELPQFARSSTGSAQVARRTIFEDIVDEARWLLERQHDPQRVSVVLTSLTAQFQGARITSFLPALIFKKASEHLAKLEVTPSVAVASEMAAPAAQLDFLRFEFKYVLDARLRDRIENAIGHFMTVDPFAIGQDDQSYFVRSLYYDDASLSAYRQKVDGMLLRSKFRLRTYASDPEQACATYLEIKGRYDSLVFKHRTQIGAADGNRAFAACDSTTRQILERLDESPVADKFRFGVARRNLAPVMLVDYVRRPYVSKHDPDFRLTFDSGLHGLATSRLFSNELQSRRQLLPGDTVMEIKFKSTIPLWFHRIIKINRLQRRSLSKVCKGMEVCNLTPDLA